MSLLNIRLSSLALAFDPETDEWLLYEILEGGVCMKYVQSSVSYNDTELTISLSTLKRCLKITKNQKYNTNELVGLRTYDGSDDTLQILTGIYAPSFQYDKYFDYLPLATVAVSNPKVSTPVEISDRNTVIEMDVDGSHDSKNVSDDATISDIVRKFFPWLGCFEGKVSLVEKTKAGI